MYTTFGQTSVYILHTKFSWQSSCIRTFVEMWYTFCIHSVYISCILLVQFLYTKCLRSFRMEQNEVRLSNIDHETNSEANQN